MGVLCSKLGSLVGSFNTGNNCHGTVLLTDHIKHVTDVLMAVISVDLHK